MTRNGEQAADLSFLAGGGEIGALIRAKDWSNSRLGPAAQWPDALKLMLGVVLSNRSPMLLWWGPDHVAFYNDACRSVLGAAHPRALGVPVREIESEVAHALEPLIDASYHGAPSSGAADIRLEIERDGSLEETQVTFACSPVPDATAPRGIGGVLATVAASVATARVDDNQHLIELRQKTDAALRASEERLRALVNASSDVVYSMSADWTEMRRLDGRGFLADKQEPGVLWIDEYILPEDQPMVLAAIERAVSGRRVFELEHRVRRIDGTVGWTQSRAIPIFAGEDIVEWFGMASDVTERREGENHRRLLLNELNHRVKNTLAIVQSLVRQSLKDVEGSKEARDLLDTRLIALAKAHDTLTREHWEGAPIESVVEDALRPLRPERARISIDGPSVSLSPRQVIALSMALHELGTNALKHGALSATGGKVRLCWNVEAGSVIVIEWIETAGPRVEPPRHRGFGLRLLERSLGQDLDGEVALVFAPDGVHCTIRAALETRRALTAADLARGAERHG
ncbi:MAG: HWE histidine kinase domain-containing protein [Rhodanobacteraceae bacterium]